MERNSSQKETILKGLEEFCIHPTAEELYLRIKPKNPSLSLGTVYRNLNKLSEGGQIRKIKGLDSKDHFDHNMSEHYHMLCLRCQKVFDVFFKMPKNFDDSISSKSGHEILDYDITFRGICEDCKGEE